MERDDAAGLALLWDAPVLAGDSVQLSASALRHALVRRVRVGDAVRLLDGLGRVAHGSVGEVSGKAASVEVSRVAHVARPVTLEVLDRKSTRLNSSHIQKSRMPSSA